MTTKGDPKAPRVDLAELETTTADRTNGNTELREVRIGLRGHVKTGSELKGILAGHKGTGRVFQVGL